MNNLKKIREAAGLSQVELGRKALINQVTISEVENNRRVPYPAFKKRVSKALGKAMKEVFPPGDHHV